MSKKEAVEFVVRLLDDGTYGIEQCILKEYVDTIYIPDKLYGVPVTKLCSFSFELELMNMMPDPKPVTVVCGKNIKHFGATVFSSRYINEVILPESLENTYSNFFTSSDFKFNIYDGIRYVGTKNNPYFMLIEPVYKGEHEYGIHPDTKIIADGAFEDCNHLLKLNIPEGVRMIGSNLLRGCNYIRELTIPNSIERLGGGCTFGCKTMYLQHYTKDDIDYIGNPSNHYLILLNGEYYTRESFKVLDETKIIYGEAFADNNKIKSIEMNDNVLCIGYGCFGGCEQLESVKLSNNIEHIYVGTFDNCKSLKYLNFPPKLVEATECFLNCSNFTISKFPKSMKEIDLYEFLDCNFADDFEISLSQVGYMSFAGDGKQKQLMERLNIVPDDDMNPDGSKIINIYKQNELQKQYKIVLDRGQYKVQLPDGTIDIVAPNHRVNLELDYYNKKINNCRRCAQMYNDIEPAEKEVLDKFDQNMYLKNVSYRIARYALARGISHRNMKDMQDHILSRISMHDLNKFLEKAQEYNFAEGAVEIIQYMRNNNKYSGPEEI
ncbi:MAG: leucine-rich repeat protein [Clostridia bacterium]|nr:leucine-rich repeat protein [Clostridia bacterium]